MDIEETESIIHQLFLKNTPGGLMRSDEDRKRDEQAFAQWQHALPNPTGYEYPLDLIMQRNCGWHAACEAVAQLWRELCRGAVAEYDRIWCCDATKRATTDAELATAHDNFITKVRALLQEPPQVKP